MKTGGDSALAFGLLSLPVAPIQPVSGDDPGGPAALDPTANFGTDSLVSNHRFP
jgi:hypothetical protein